MAAAVAKGAAAGWVAAPSAAVVAGAGAVAAGAAAAVLAVWVAAACTGKLTGLQSCDMPCAINSQTRADRYEN